MRGPHFIFLVVFLAVLPLAAQDMTLEYVGRYNRQITGPDHLVDVISIDATRAVVGSNLGLALVELSSLPTDGTRDYLDRITDIHARNVYQKDDEYLLVNLFGGECTDGSCGPGGSHGFSVVKITGNTLELIPIGIYAAYEEPETLYEKMFIDGDLLYLTAHKRGIRILDITDPEDPQMLGRIDDGFTDAWAIFVEGATAYVADGAGGLKLVDVSDPAAPVLLGGEDLDSARGTYQDVIVRDGRIYAAAGHRGLAVYEKDDLSSRTFYPVRAWAKDLDWIGNHLAVASYDAFSLFDIGDGTRVTMVAEEITQRRGGNASLRLCSAVGAGPNGEILAANWDYMDVYELVPAAESTQPDLNASLQRIRFHRDGGSREIKLWNNGQGMLDVSSVTASPASFSVDWTGGALAPGQSVTFTASYTGGDVTQGTGQISIRSNDPDEDPMVIRVYGNTNNLDPGDPVPNFTFPTIDNDGSGGLADGSFTLADHRGQVVWWTVFGSW